MKSNSFTNIRLLLFFIVLALVLAGGVMWWQDAIAPIGAGDTAPVVFVVDKGEGARSIAARLAQERLVRSSTGFFILVKSLGIEKNLQAGDFRLTRGMDAKAIAQALTHGTLDVWVTILEGWRNEEIANKLAKDLDIPEGEFLKNAHEGYMFPDTYLIPRDATVGAIVQLIEDTFEKKVTRQMREDARKLGLTFPQVVTLASVVEREGNSDQDRPVIAGILVKRLKANWPLQADATVQYSLGYQSQDKTWWKKTLYEEDKSIKSPYNTYANPGLPPGPIANPGLASIKAVIYPKETEYWYYIHDNKGVVHFAKTIEEHNANVAKYLNQ